MDSKLQKIINEGSAHWGNCTRTIGARGGVKEHSTSCRVSGSLKTWKTRPEDFRLPVKHGMRGYGEIVPANISQFHAPSECPLNNDGEIANDVHEWRVQAVTVPILKDHEFYRVVCTCGHVGKEHFFNSEAQAEGMSGHI